MIPAEWAGSRLSADLAAGFLAIYIVWAMARVSWGRSIFVVVGIGLGVWLWLAHGQAGEIIREGLRNGAFIAAFFIAQATLRHAAMSSPAIDRCGRYLASQPPGRRYLALTSGGHFFGLILSYGAISLLGGMASEKARGEPVPAIRELRIRRMLLATQRGFISTLSWSPLAFSYAVTTSIVEGSSWSGAVRYGVVNALILAGLGWLMDHSIKPAVRPAARPNILGTKADLVPLVILLAVIMGSVALLHFLSAVRIVGIVLVAVPAISIGWVVVQSWGEGGLSQIGASGRKFVDEIVPSYRGEVVLLSMAAFIGTVGSAILLPLVGDSATALEVLPGWAVLIAVVWAVPLGGLIGMNPVLCVTLLAPLLPSASDLHVDPNILVVAMTAGWALGGAISPFTATTLIVGLLGKVTAWHVGWNWNGVYTLIAGSLLSLWVVLAAVIHAP